MARFLVERYVPGATEATFSDLAASLRSHFEAEVEDNVRYLGSIIVPGDDACMCLFEADSIEAVAAANDDVGAPADRIVRVVSVLSEEIRL